MNHIEYTRFSTRWPGWFQTETCLKSPYGRTRHGEPSGIIQGGSPAALPRDSGVARHWLLRGAQSVAFPDPQFPGLANDVDGRTTHAAGHVNFLSTDSPGPVSGSMDDPLGRRGGAGQEIRTLHGSSVFRRLGDLRRGSIRSSTNAVYFVILCVFLSGQLATQGSTKDHK